MSPKCASLYPIIVVTTSGSKQNKVNLYIKKPKEEQLGLARAKGQLISKQDCRAITSPKKRTLDFYF